MKPLNNEDAKLRKYEIKFEVLELDVCGLLTILLFVPFEESASDLLIIITILQR